VKVLIAPAVKTSFDAESDRNPILTGILLSDKFLARYSPPQPENIRFQSEADGQLSLLNFEVVTESEPPDPDDFESLDAFREAIARWDWEHPSSFDHCSDHLPSSQDNDVSSQDNALGLPLDSFCLWAHCPADWYEPTALLELSKVSELSPTCKSSITSDFFIPTFGSLARSVEQTRRTADTGFLPGCPSQSRPKSPPQAATWEQVEHKLGTSWTQVTPSQLGIPKLSRNYPETIPILFHRVAAGSSTKPGPIASGGDSMS
jgi:hypothetical protein